MRVGLALIVVAICATNFSERACARNKAEKKTIVAQSGTPGGHGRDKGRCWHRSSGGQLFVWSGGRWVPMAADSAHAQSAVPNIRTGDRAGASGPGQPAQAKSDIVNGLDWYLIGRGYSND